MRAVVLIALTMMGLGCFPAAAEEGSGEQLSKTQLDKWSEYYQAKAAEYEIRLEEDGPILKMHPQPLTRWTNLVVSPDLTHGECFVWTHNGRPEAFVSLFSYNHQNKRRVAHAWNSLSRHSLVGSFDGTEFWTPAGPGIREIKPIPGAPAPAETRTQRLVQMRRIARGFTARSGGTDGQKELSLRLLATPVYRYQGESEEALDGGLFAFVTGTDPEVLLLIEARQVDGSLQWQYMPLRHSHLTLRVKFEGAPVWESLRGSQDYSIPERQRVYLSQHGIDTQERILP